MWYKESDGMWAPRYEVRRSGVMEYVASVSGQSITHDDMYGVYASRTYMQKEAITAYVGRVIGAFKGERDGNAGYREMERMAAPRDDGSEGKGGRHVMVVGEDLVDGADGYTGAQYINAAYHIPAAVGVNKAEMKAGGTIRVMKRKTIYEGEEILMAYHDGYWSRWRPSNVRPRGRPQRQRQGGGDVETTSNTAAEGDGGGHDGGHAHGDSERNGGVSGTQSVMQGAEVERHEQGGVRIGVMSGVLRQPEGDGPRRGRPRQGGERDSDVLGKRHVSSTKWSTLGRDAYRQVQRRGDQGERFERGEGGGVT